MHKCKVFWSCSHIDKFFFACLYWLRITCNYFRCLRLSAWTFTFLHLSGRESLFPLFQSRKRKIMHGSLKYPSISAPTGCNLLRAVWILGDLFSKSEDNLQIKLPEETFQWALDSSLFIFRWLIAISIFREGGTLRQASSCTIELFLLNLVFLRKDTLLMTSGRWLLSWARWSRW